MTSNDPYPDIEIYLRQPDLEAITDWLDARFGIRERQRSGMTITCSLDSPAMDCVIVEGATKGFTSVWFKSARTPWETDRDCARDAFARFGVEIRCSTGSWHEKPVDEGGNEAAWLVITDAGENIVRWN